MKTLLSAITLFIVLLNTVSAQCTYTLRPSADGKDSYVFSHSPYTAYAQASGGKCDTFNFGSESGMAVIDWTFMSDPGSQRSYLEFDLSQLMSLGCTATNATLILPHSGVSSNYHCGLNSASYPCQDNAIMLSRVTEAWDENTITWVNQPAAANATAGSDYVVLPNQPDPYATYSVDITQMVNGWLTSATPNYGMRFQFANEGTYYKRVCWGTSENPDSTRRPYLVITMGACNACNNVLQGTVYNDQNGNCAQNPNDAGLKNWIIKATPGPFYTNTDSLGNYSMNVPNGNYTIEQLIPNTYLWSAVCPSPNYVHHANVNGADVVNNLDFAVHASMNCPQLWVDIGADRLRPCHLEMYYVNYCNNGNDTANNVTIDLKIDSALAYQYGSIPVGAQNGNIYTFNIGTLVPGQCGQFNFAATVSCFAMIGQTKCVEAAIKPYYNCAEPVNPAWDHSSVSVSGECNDSLACFTITNNGAPGNGDMDGPSAYRIYANGILVHAGTFQMTGGSDTVICWPANGNTIQLQADQRPNHPGNSHPNDYVEDCGTPNDSLPVYGIINTTPPDDANADVEIDCQQVFMSWDPNDKTVIPTGFGSQGYIMSSDELEYKIRFQNTGNDTAFNIIVRDTLSSLLDPATVVSGVSSHNYSFQISGNGILQWTFTNILLPDSNVNEPLSHGFVKFRVKQRPGNQPGNEIKNRVGIIFDINAPVMTNTTLNTIWLGPPSVIGIKSNGVFAQHINVFPNPTDGLLNIEMKDKTISTWNVVITDALGRTVTKQNGTGSNTVICDLHAMKPGVYFYTVLGNGNTVGVGKVIVY